MIWTPEHGTPISSDETLDFVIEACMDKGTEVVVARAIDRLRTDQELLAGYVEHLGLLIGRLTGDPTVHGAFTAGAGLAALSYNFTGYYADVDEQSLHVSMDYLRTQPKPEIFDAATAVDLQLASMLDFVAPVLEGGYPDQGGGLQNMRLGAGCVRIFLGHALAS
jgi:hypothetical protein